MLQDARVVPLLVRQIRLAPWLICACIAVGPLRAQPASEVLLVGARVRVVDTVNQRTDYAGTFMRRNGDTLVIVGRHGAAQALRLRQWHRLDVSVARRRHVVRNGLIGAASGALVLAAVGAAIVDPAPSRSDVCVPLGPDGSCWNVVTGGTPRYMGAAVGGAYGAGLGGIIGALTGIPRRDQWAPFQPGTRGLSVTVGARMVMVRLPFGRGSQ